MARKAELPGAVLGLAAAALFGLSTPLSKKLLAGIEPVMLAGLLYTGGGTGLWLASRWAAAGSRSASKPGPVEAPLRGGDWWVLAAITFCGGMLGPVLMLFGLSRLSGSAGALLLNLEAPFTIALAVLLFHEHLGRAAAWGGALICAGAALLSWAPGPVKADIGGVTAIAGACLLWGLDNNLTQKLTARDPSQVVRWKALGAGFLLLAGSAARGTPLPPLPLLLGALGLGSVAYGLSILLDALALRRIGAAREAAYFAAAPFVGALASLPLLDEAPRPSMLLAAVPMAAGVWLLVREKHSHRHAHPVLEHEHAHTHDAHHDHSHAGAVTPGEVHSHAHRHELLEHEHPHLSDAHHRHPHR